MATTSSKKKLPFTKDKLTTLAKGVKKFFHLIARNLLKFRHSLLLGNGQELGFETIHGQTLVHGLTPFLSTLDVAVQVG
jgi:hypothetical protein